MSASETVWLAASLAIMDELPAKGPMLALALGVWFLTAALLWLNRLFSELPQGVRVLGGESRWLALFGLAFSWLLYGAVVLLALGAAQAHMGFLQHIPYLADLAQALDGFSLPTPDSAGALARTQWWLVCSAALALVAEVLRWLAWRPVRLQAQRNAHALLERLTEEVEPQARSRSVVKYR